MPAKEKKEKPKREKKARKEKKPKKEKKTKRDNKKGAQTSNAHNERTIERKLAVFGDSNAMNMLFRMSTRLSYYEEGTRINFLLKNYESSDSSQTVDAILGVYDIREMQSFDYLKNQALGQAKNGNSNVPCFIAGLGLEYRSYAHHTLVPTAYRDDLSRSSGCLGTELFTSDSDAVAAGLMSLFCRQKPYFFRDSTTTAGTTETGKKKKKEKKPRKEKKNKRDSKGKK